MSVFFVLTLQHTKVSFCILISRQDAVAKAVKEVQCSRRQDGKRIFRPDTATL